jgi:hypothetical protein
MTDIARFPYLAVKNARNETLQRPLLPIRLSIGNNQLEVTGLLDTGADVNVLPYSTGIALGADWEQARAGLQLSGNLAQYPARGLLVDCAVAQFPQVRLAFAWSRSDSIPLLLGQVNFFAEFDVCFLRSVGIFEVQPKR